MPVTIKPSPGQEGRNVDPIVNNPQALLSAASIAWFPHRETREGKQAESREILQTSLATDNVITIPYGNGFVHGAIRAFQQDLHLVLRPDDIWLSILTQFSMYVNKNAEKLRSKFVAHDDKKDLALDISPASVWDVGIGRLAQQMTVLLHENVVDPGLRDWIMPDFSTTTDNDRGVASVVMMGTLQKYFNYIMIGGCGLPSVTLLGEVSDWQKILARLDKLPLYGVEPAEWAKLLVPILNRMIATFYIPDSPELKQFWMCICHHDGVNSSGDMETLSGWITAFTYWGEEGYCLDIPKEWRGRKDRATLMLDDVEYPLIQTGGIPDGIVKVPLMIQDLKADRVYQCTLVAGSVGMIAEPKGNSTVVQPRSGWWLLQDSVEDM